MLRNILNKIYTLAVLAIAFFPRDLKAQIFQGGDSATKEGVRHLEGALAGSGVAETRDVGDLIIKYINFSMPYLALAAFVGFVYAGFLYVTAYGNEEQIKKSKTILIYAIVGLVLVMVSFSIVEFFTVELVKGIKGE